jgi:hypothetical protein
MAALGLGTIILYGILLAIVELPWFGRASHEERNNHWDID